MIRYSDYPMGIFEGYGEAVDDPITQRSEMKIDYQETWYEKAERERYETLTNPSPNGVKPPHESYSCCDGDGCGTCITGDSLAAYFPQD